MKAGTAAWTDLMTAGTEMVATGARATEMMLASSSVIGARMTIMSRAACHPAEGDYAEIGDMMMEKAVAAAKVNQALVEQWSAVLIDTSEQAQHLRQLMLGGRPLHADDILELAERWTAHGMRMLTRTMDAGGLALAPVHQQATANARRLSEQVS
ncbi:hypothetical protein [Paracoccus benzoatiresistens]|uniref:Phasin family protein n=1 Tax=Paracoccus benzoatiresistens TaxID=2997341 RepID=A0ABT4JAV0_9RHOB|nr:hypothetical protein [Paracoccus sp. EF6]MCZ0964249.1 hypothetical protein [Paracoccus sp. EF6]